MPARGWNRARRPSAAGLQVQALATGFEHPRIVYPLPNGDVLVVESNGPGGPVYRPKDYIEGKIKALAGTGAKGGQRITLLRDTDGDGKPDVRTMFIDHLNSPYGVVLVGNDLYVANTDAILRFPYVDGADQITAPGVKLTDLPAQSPNHHWTKSMTASPDGSKLYVGVGSNSNITENGIGAEEGRAAIWEVDRATGMKRIYASGVRNPTGLAFEPTTRQLWAIANERDEIGPDLVPDYLTAREGERVLRLAVQLLGSARRRCACSRSGRTSWPARSRPITALGSHVAPLGLAFTRRQALPAAVPQRRVHRRARQLGPRSAGRLQGRLRPVPERPADRHAAGRGDGLPRRRARRAVGRSASPSTRRARCWWLTTSATRSGASPPPTPWAPLRRADFGRGREGL